MANRNGIVPGAENLRVRELLDANDRLNGDQCDANGNTKSAPVSQPPVTPQQPGAGRSPLNAQQILDPDSYDSENRLTQRNGSNGNGAFGFFQ